MLGSLIRCSPPSKRNERKQNAGHQVHAIRGSPTPRGYLSGPPNHFASLAVTGAKLR
jgi:hypothetical protein